MSIRCEPCRLACVRPAILAHLASSARPCKAILPGGGGVLCKSYPLMLSAIAHRRRSLDTTLRLSDGSWWQGPRGGTQAYNSPGSGRSRHPERATIYLGAGCRRAMGHGSPRAGSAVRAALCLVLLGTCRPHGSLAVTIAVRFRSCSAAGIWRCRPPPPPPAGPKWGARAMSIRQIHAHAHALLLFSTARGKGSNTSDLATLHPDTARDPLPLWLLQACWRMWPVRSAR